MKRRTAMLLSALFAAGAIATYSNTAKADTITQPKGQIPEANIETKSTNEGLQQKQVQLGARKSPDLNQKTNKNISTTPVQNNQQLHITHQVEHNNNNWYQMQNKSWLPSSYTTDVKQKQSVQAKQNVQNAQPVQNSNTQTQAQSQNNWHKESADFVTGGVINLRTAPNTNSAIIEAMPTGSTIKYDAYQKIDQYTWLRQPREDGSYGYIVGRNNGVAWGTFKESAAKPVENKPATKHVENKPATKPVESKPATKPVDNKPATKPVDSKPATKPVESKPATKPVDNKPATNEENIGIIKLPAGYTREMIEDCSGGQDGGDDTKSTLTPLARELSKEGIKMNMNSYRNSDSREVDLTNITPEQARELTDFTLNTINHVRKQMGLKPYMYSERTQKIANNIAKNYVKDNRDTTGGHDCVAITDAMRQDHALDSITKSVSNPVENMGGWYIDTNTVNGDKNHETMGSIKEKLYFNIEQMLFGGYTNGIVGEMYHARSLTNPVTTHLGAMYGFSISKIPNSNVVTSHFITFSNFDGFDEFLPDFHD